jgi:hypothetical protein
MGAPDIFGFAGNTLSQAPGGSWFISHFMPQYCVSRVLFGNLETMQRATSQRHAHHSMALLTKTQV